MPGETDDDFYLVAERREDFDAPVVRWMRAVRHAIENPR
jgi:hypothetical protein